MEKGEGERWTNNVEGPAGIAGRAARSLSMVEAERLASTAAMGVSCKGSGEAGVKKPYR